MSSMFNSLYSVVNLIRIITTIPSWCEIQDADHNSAGNELLFTFYYMPFQFYVYNCKKYNCIIVSDDSVCMTVCVPGL